jgi:myo-inositol-1-phosphate synthase
VGRKVRVAIVGVGNCASSLVQGVEYYRGADSAARVPGLMHVELGDYHVGDIEFVAAFDVDAKKVGRDLAEAIVAPPNNTLQFAEVPPTGVQVLRGPTLDGFGHHYRLECEESDEEPVDVAAELRRARTDVVVCYLPVGSEDAARFYANEALAAHAAFVNCLPVFIASDTSWAEKFSRARVPIIGDDVKSQVGSTIIHRLLTRLFEDRGVTVDRTYQLNFGGNMDFMNMLERPRLVSKKISKTQSVASQLSAALHRDNIHIGPSDHVPWLQDRKWAYIRMEGRNFGDAPLNVEVKLEVWDSPNSAGVVIDAVRCAKLALDRGIGGPLVGPASYFMKSPPVQFPDDVCRQLVEEFIAGSPPAIGLQSGSIGANGHRPKRGRVWSGQRVQQDPGAVSQLARLAAEYLVRTSRRNGSR